MLSEDYTIAFYNCDPPKNVSGRVYSNDIIANWDPVLSANKYKIRYSQGNSWKSASTSGTEFRLEDAPAGSYIFQVHAICGGDWSEGSAQVNIGIGGNDSSGHRISNIGINATANGLDLLTLFPNPTNSAINISYTAVREQVTIQVKDILGRNLLTQQAQNADNQVTSIEVIGRTKSQNNNT